MLEDALLVYCGESHPLLSPTLQRVRIANSSLAEKAEDDMSDNESVEDLGATLIINGDSHRYIGSENTEVSRTRSSYGSRKDLIAFTVRTDTGGLFSLVGPYIIPTDFTGRPEY